MKVTTFTDTMIKKLKAADKKYIRGEGNGFTIRVMPSGVKTWLYVYSIDGKRREMNLGNYDDGKGVSLETARDKFDAAKKKVRNGIDPIAELEEQLETKRNALTVEKLVDDYIKLHAKKFKRSWEKDAQILNRDIIPLWGKRKAEDVKRKDVVSLLDGIVARNAPIMANNTFAVIRKMFNWALEKGKLESTPCLGLKLPSPRVECDRVFSEKEIGVFWESLERTDLNMSVEIRKALKLVLVTAQRPGEVIGMHTNEIDGHWWTLPAGRSKNGREHRVYLTDTALDLIGPIKVLDKETKEMKPKGYIFKTPLTKKDKPIGETALPIAVMRNLNYPVIDEKGKPATENRLGVDPFTPHDLRRTAATFMSQIGCMDEVIDAVLNHKKKGIIKAYNKNKYDTEKQAALTEWELKLSCVLSGAEYRTREQREQDRRDAEARKAAEERKDNVVSIGTARKRKAA